MKKKQSFNWVLSENANSRKILLAMKLTILLILVTFGSLYASVSYSQSARLSLSLNDASVMEVLNKIEDESEFYFLYNKKLIDVERKVSVIAENRSIKEILDKLFKGTDVIYSVVDRQIVLSDKAIMQQGKTVTGKVIDADGLPLPGVTVIIKHTALGTVTGTDGSYSLDNVPEDGILVFSFVGMLTQEIKIGNQSVINVTLETNIVGLDEVIAIGYGTVKKSDLTGSVASVRSEDFGDRGGTGVSSLLQGKVPGLDVTEGKIRVRGVTTINNTDPLFVIDGFIDGNMSTVHPNDIESIEILKDASATAIYGARGANGVILVTTKKGKEGAPEIDVSTYYGISSPAKRLEMLNAQQYMNLITDIEINGGTTREDLGAFSKIYNADGTPNAYSITQRTDWQNEIFNTATSEEVTMSIRGGSSRTSYNVSTAYNNSNSIQGLTNMKNYRVGLIGDWWVISDKFKLTESFRVHHYNTNGTDADFVGGLRMPPYAPIYDENAIGGYSYVTTTDDLNDAANPLTGMNNTDYYSKGINIMAQLGAEIHFLKYFTFNSSIGVTGNSYTTNTWNNPTQNGNLVNPDYQLTENFGFSYAPRIENYLNYNAQYGQHEIAALIGTTYENGAYGRSVSVYGKGFLNDKVRNVTVADESAIRSNSGSHSAYMSYFGRINYVFANKYLLTVNVRADGSDVFAPEYRWGYFPSVAAGWKINEEKFFKSTLVSQLKLRASYGITGNDAIGQYQYFSSVHSNVTYAFPSEGSSTLFYNGATINTLASPAIRWEETENLSFGVDLGLFKNKLEINADYFHKNTYDILFAVPQPPSLGMGFNGGGGNAIVNAASVLNNGVELNASYKNRKGDWSYKIQGNVTFVKNEVTSLGSGEPYNAGSFGFYSTNRTELGHSIGYFYGFKMDKVYATQTEVDADNQAARAAAKAANPDLTDADLANIYYQSAETQAGDIRFFDLPDEDGNFDGKITDDDRTDLGSPIPKMNFGLTATVKYKDFDFYMSWTGVTGNKILYEFGYWMEGMIRPFNSTSNVLDRWISESEPGNGVIPRAVKTDPSKNLRMSDRFIYDGSYVRMNLASIGYTIPENLINSTFKGAVSSARIYFSADNLITISNYPGYNPEIGGDNTERGADGGTSPVPRTFRFGVNVTF